MSSLHDMEQLCIAELENAQQCQQIDRDGYVWSHPTLGKVTLTNAEYQEGLLNQRQTAQTGINFGGIKEIAEVKFMNMQHVNWMSENDPRTRSWEVPPLTWLFMLAATTVGLLMLIPENTGGVIA